MAHCNIEDCHKQHTVCPLLLRISSLSWM